MITNVPPFPLRTQGLVQSVYSAGVEASLAAIPQAIIDMNELGTALNLATKGTSTTSNTIGTGAKTFTTQTGLGFSVGNPIRVANSGVNYITADVTSYNSGTGALVINGISVSGSGTFTSWTISLAAVGASSAGAIVATPGGNLSGTTVQAQLTELDTEKLSASAGAVTGTNLEDIITGSSVGSITAIPIITYDANGRITAVGSAINYPCRAWVNFNGTGTVAIRGGGNVSSITDNGTGDYTVNFTTAISDANYAICVGLLSPSTASTHRISASSTTSFSINTYQWTGTTFGTPVDMTAVSCAIFR